MKNDIFVDKFGVVTLTGDMDFQDRAAAILDKERGKERLKDMAVLWQKYRDFCVASGGTRNYDARAELAINFLAYLDRLTTKL